jgi:hypothetical protein
MNGRDMKLKKSEINVNLKTSQKYVKYTVAKSRRSVTALRLPVPWH